MAKVYVTRCIVKKDGENYKKGSVIKGLTDEEIKQGLAEHWLEAVGNDDNGDDEEPTEKKPNKPPKTGKTGKPGKANQGPTVPPGEALLKEAAEAGVTVTEKMTVEEIERLIAETKARE
jgi:hypothetical protein